MKKNRVTSQIIARGLWLLFLQASFITSRARVALIERYLKPYICPLSRMSWVPISVKAVIRQLWDLSKQFNLPLI